MISVPDAFTAPWRVHRRYGRNAFIGKATPAAVLLVNADGEVRRKIEGDLTRAGFSVVAVSSFAVGRRLLATVYPDVLIADVRLGAFNGLHLALLSRLDRPDVRVFITHTSPDPVLEREAAACGAQFVVAPVDDPDFVADVQARAAMRAVRRVSGLSIGRDAFRGEP